MTPRGGVSAAPRAHPHVEEIEVPGLAPVRCGWSVQRTVIGGLVRSKGRCWQVSPSGSPCLHKRARSRSSPRLTRSDADSRGCAPVSNRTRQGHHLSDLEKPVLSPQGQGAGARKRPRPWKLRVVTADLDTSEPLAERLRRCDGDTGPQRAHSSRSRGECASAQALPSRRGESREVLPRNAFSPPQTTRRRWRDSACRPFRMGQREVGPFGARAPPGSP